MKLIKQQYDSQQDLFKILEINEQDALNKDLGELSRLIKKQRDKLALKYHSDKGGSNELMQELNVAKKKLDSF